MTEKIFIPIGKSIIFDVPNIEFDLIYCTNCQGLFNTEIKDRIELDCPQCKTKLKDGRKK